MRLSSTRGYGRAPLLSGRGVEGPAPFTREGTRLRRSCAPKLDGDALNSRVAAREEGRAARVVTKTIRRRRRALVWRFERRARLELSDELVPAEEAGDSLVPRRARVRVSVLLRAATPFSAGRQSPSSGPRGRRAGGRKARLRARPAEVERPESTTSTSRWARGLAWTRTLRASRGRLARRRGRGIAPSPASRSRRTYDRRSTRRATAPSRPSRTTRAASCSSSPPRTPGGGLPHRLPLPSWPRPPRAPESHAATSGLVGVTCWTPARAEVRPERVTSAVRPRSRLRAERLAPGPRGAADTRGRSRGSASPAT